MAKSRTSPRGPSGSKKARVPVHAGMRAFCCRGEGCVHASRAAGGNGGRVVVLPDRARYIRAEDCSHISLLALKPSRARTIARAMSISSGIRARQVMGAGFAVALGAGLLVAPLSVSHAEVSAQATTTKVFDIPGVDS